MLKEIKLRFGESHAANLSFKTQPINVIVGPNNSGKSLFLREILQFLTSKKSLDHFLIIEEINLNKLSEEELDKILYNRKNPIGNPDLVAIFDSYNNYNEAYDIKTFKQQYLHSTTTNPNLDQFILKFMAGQSILLLNGQTRLDSLSWKQFTTLDEKGDVYNNAVNRIINNDEIYNKLQQYIYDAFNVYPEIKINGSHAQIVLSKTKIPEELRLSVKAEATNFLQHSQNFENTSDGRKAYIGIISEIISGNPDTILLDEPEAFLHPPLARKLGNTISKLATEENKNIFISSHSSDFIMGSIESRVPMNIIRLTYDGEKANAKLLDNASLSKMMKNPLLRSTNVLDGIFYKNVVVTESDSDRVFYQEINHRLKEFKPDWHIEDCLFLNAQNKQTVGWITKELRKIGIPTVSVIDLDLIKDGGKVFTDYLKSVNIPENQHPSLSTFRDSIKVLFPDIAKTNSELKTKGINSLDSVNKTLLETFLNILNTYGLFPVPIGELESWLSEVYVEGHGNNWITKKFELMGDDPESKNYTKPNDDDVWLFIKQIKEWLDNPDRRGM